MKMLIVTLLAHSLINAEILNKGARPQHDADMFNCSKCFEHTDNFDYLTAIDVFAAIGNAINTELSTKPTVSGNETRLATLTNTININLTSESDVNLNPFDNTNFALHHNDCFTDNNAKKLYYIMIGLTSFGLILNLINMYFTIHFYVKLVYTEKSYISANTVDNF